MTDSDNKEPHVSCNACHYGIDLALTDPTDGSIKMVQWSWDEVRAFVEAHGDDVTRGVTDLLQDHLSK